AKLHERDFRAHICERRHDLHADPDALGVTIDDVRREVRALFQPHDGDHVWHVCSPLRGCGPARNGVGIHRAAARYGRPRKFVVDAERRDSPWVIDVPPRLLRTLQHEPMLLCCVPERLRDRVRLGQWPGVCSRRAGVVVGHQWSLPRMSETCSLMMPPLPFTNASRGFFTCRPCARPMSCRAASVTCDMPPASPAWPNDSWPPWGFSGKSPSN